MSYAKRIFSVLLLSVFCILTMNRAAFGAMKMGSKYYCLLDAGNNQVLAGENIDVRRPIASTTKIMTAIISAEYCDLDEIAVVSKGAAKTLPYTIGLKAGQQIKLEDLLKVSLIRSANDAAVVLAEHVAGDELFFAHLMNLKAFALGAVNTRFQNASGLPNPDHYSSVYDLLLFSNYALKQATISSIVAINQTSFNHPSYKQPMTIYNTNSLISTYPGANGVKTGTTNAAGPCLVASALRGDRQLIAVVLNSNNRAGDCAKLLDYGFKETKNAKIIDKNEIFKEVLLSSGEEAYLPIYPAGDLDLYLGLLPGAISKVVDFNYNIETPIVFGQKLGTINVYAYGKFIAPIDLIAGKKVEEKHFHWFDFLAKLFAKEE